MTTNPFTESAAQEPTDAEIMRATAREATDLVVEYRDEHVVTIAYTTPSGERTVLEVMSYGEPLAIYRSTEHEPTDAEVDAVAASILWKTGGRHWEDITDGERREYREYARAALSAARAARRDEENR